MSVKLTWLGHGSWAIAAGEHTLLLDPFLDDSPTSPVSSKEVSADVILVSHGHFDHVADAAKIANRTGAPVLANYEVCEWLGKHQQVENTIGMNLGGQTEIPGGTAKLTIAWHSSSMPDGSYGGNPGGWLLNLGGKRIYFACDTALFSDMQRIGSVGLDLAVLPIGDLFTMGPADSLEAIRLLRPKHVAPAHYNTWPPIEQDADAWADQVRNQTTAKPIVVQPGESFTV